MYALFACLSQSGAKISQMHSALADRWKAQHLISSRAELCLLKAHPVYKAALEIVENLANPKGVRYVNDSTLCVCIFWSLV